MNRRDNRPTHPSRRAFIRLGAALAAMPLAAALPSRPAAAANKTSILTRPIPVSGEPLPLIGLGSWLTFDVGPSERGRARSADIMRAFFARGGDLIDSSPMYGSAEAVIGAGLQGLGPAPGLFAASKVWIMGRSLGIYQMQQSRALWQVPRFDLMQIHNMLNWRAHIETLKAWREQGRVRYIGVTTSHGRRHAKLEQALLAEDFDFVQFTYNIVDREAERRLLPLAREKGIAVIANRPFRRGALFERVRHKPLPSWAAEIDCQNWAQFFLKFIISHPAVSCAIPATSQLAHLHENMGAAYGRLSDTGQRARMAGLFS